MAIGAAIAVAAIAAFPVIVGVGVVGAGLAGAAVVGLGTVSMLTGAAALGAKIGKLIRSESGSACSAITQGSPKTICESKAVARVGDINNHNTANLSSGSQKVFEGGKPVSRVSEAASCGAGKVLRGAAKTIVGGPSTGGGGGGGADGGGDLFDSVVGWLDTISTWTGLAQLPLLATAAFRTGASLALGRAAGAASGSRATMQLGMQQSARAGLGTASGRAAAVAAVRNSPAMQATVGGVREIGKQGWPIAAVYGAQTVATPYMQQGFEAAGMSTEQAEVAAEAVNMIAPFGFGPVRNPTRETGRLVQGRDGVYAPETVRMTNREMYAADAANLRTAVADVRGGNYMDAAFGRVPGMPRPPTGAGDAGPTAAPRDMGDLRQGPDGVYEPAGARGGDDVPALPAPEAPGARTTVEPAPAGDAPPRPRAEVDPALRGPGAPWEQRMGRQYHSREAFEEGGVRSTGGTRDAAPPPRETTSTPDPAPRTPDAEPQLDWERHVMRQPGFNADNPKGRQYGEGAERALQAELADGTPKSLQERLDSFAQRRQEIAREMGDRDAAEFGVRRTDMTPDGELGAAYTPMTGDRYGDTGRKIQEMLRPDEFGRIIKGEIGGETVDLTSLYRYSPYGGPMLQHTPAENLPRVMQHIDAMYRDTMGREGLTPQQVIERAGYMHWWLAQAMPFNRGSAAISDMAIKHLLISKGVEPGAFKPGVVPDLVALTTESPVAFAKQYAQMFERLTPVERPRPKTNVDGRGTVGGESAGATPATHAHPGGGAGPSCATCGNGGPGAGSLPTNPSIATANGSRAGANSVWTPPPARPFERLGNGQQSWARSYEGTNGDVVVKRLRREQLTAQKQETIEIAREFDRPIDTAALDARHTMSREELGALGDKMVKEINGVADAFPGQVPRAEVAMDGDRMRLGIIVQEKVTGGIEYENLGPIERAAADDNMRAMIAGARERLGIDQWNTPKVEDGHVVQIDTIPANFRFNPDGTVKHWFDPVIVVPQKMVVPDASPTGGRTDPDATRLRNDPDATRLLNDPDATRLQNDPDATRLQNDPNATRLQNDPNAPLEFTPVSRVNDPNAPLEFTPVSRVNDPNAPLEFTPTPRSAGTSAPLELVPRSADPDATRLKLDPDATRLKLEPMEPSAPRFPDWSLEPVDPKPVARSGPESWSLEPMTSQPAAPVRSPTTPAEFFDGATFGRKVDKGYRVQRDEQGRPVLSDPKKMGWDDHSIPHEEVAAMARAGHLDGAAILDTKVGADGNEVARLKVPTEYAVKGDPSNIQKGYFEFIREPDGSINHAYFRYDPAFFDAHAGAASKAGPTSAFRITSKGTIGTETSAVGKGRHAGPGSAGGSDCTVCGASGEAKSAGGGALSDPGLAFPATTQGPRPELVPSSHALVPQKVSGGSAAAVSDRLSHARGVDIPAADVARAADVRRLQQALQNPDDIARALSQAGIDNRVVIAPAEKGGATGDFVKVVRDGNMVNVLVGDAAGFGTAAGDASNWLHGVAESADVAKGGVVDAAKRMGAAVSEGTADRMFTLGMTRFDSATGEFTSIASGHEPLFVLRADGAVEKLAHSAGPPLMEGMPMPMDDAAVTGKLGKGDKLILVSDGVADGLGDTRLETVLGALPPNASPAAVEQAVVDRLSSVAGARKLDDVVFLVLGR